MLRELEIMDTKKFKPQDLLYVFNQLHNSKLYGELDIKKIEKFIKKLRKKWPKIIEPRGKFKPDKNNINRARNKEILRNINFLLVLYHIYPCFPI